MRRLDHKSVTLSYLYYLSKTKTKHNNNNKNYKPRINRGKTWTLSKKKKRSDFGETGSDAGQQVFPFFLLSFQWFMVVSFICYFSRSSRQQRLVAVIWDDFTFVLICSCWLNLVICNCDRRWVMSTVYEILFVLRWISLSNISTVIFAA